ncbi:MAG TPA: DMT family transporter, partial [Kineosporiaceae bacterium]|nr:DMT family transporter [Kineosporiaceae bacterium]
SAFGAVATAPVAAARSRHEIRALGRRRCSASLLAGVLLAAHFGLWIPSLRLTSVTASIALVTSAPLWTVLIERARGVRVRPGVLVGVGLALAGVVAVTGADAGRSPSALLGDLLALGGGVAGAGYVLVGEHARRSTSTTVYTLVAYSGCAVVLVGICLLTRTPLAGWSVRTWSELLLLTLVAQLLGHTAFNAAVPVVGATPLSLAILLEVPGAAVVAWLWLRQTPPVGVIPGALLVLAGLALVLRARSSSRTDQA